MKKTLFIKNAAILTVTSLLLRFMGIVFKVWLSNTVGREGIGLYQLVFSVYVLASTFAMSGISTAVTRLVAEEMAKDNTSCIVPILKKAVFFSLSVAFVSSGLLIFFSRIIAIRLLEDERAVFSLNILALTLPFLAISSCFRGYFIARRKVTPATSSQIFEQIIRIVTVVLLIRRFRSYSLSVICAAIFIGDTVAEAFCTLVMYLLYKKDRNKIVTEDVCQKDNGYGKKIVRIAFPITLGRYLNSALRTAENILVPKNLLKYDSTSNALSLFGMIKGMALPILFFPSTLLNALSTLLIPEMTEAMAKKRNLLVKLTVERIIKTTCVISLIFAAIFFVIGEKIGILIYNSKDVGFLLFALAPIVPLMYLDSVCDGILKGLDQQVFTFRTSVADSAIRIFLVVTVLPKYGMFGFIGIMYFSNMLTCFLNVGRLIYISGAKIEAIKNVIIPLSAAFMITSLLKFALSEFADLSGLVYIILFCGISLAAYGAFILTFKIISIDEIKSIVK